MKIYNKCRSRNRKPTLTDQGPDSPHCSGEDMRGHKRKLTHTMGSSHKYT